MPIRLTAAALLLAGCAAVPSRHPDLTRYCARFRFEWEPRATATIPLPSPVTPSLAFVATPICARRL